MRILKALLVLLIIPAVLALIGVFQDYADAHMTLNTLEDIAIRFAPFVIIALFIFGIFKAISHINRGDKGDDE